MDNYFFYTQKLCVGYNNKILIEDIKIELPKGEILTLIGSNGAGKSTILKSIAGQLKTISGAVYLEHENLTKMSSELIAKKMSVVFTERIKTELMTCKDVVATGRYPYTGRFGILSQKDWEIVEETMELVHVTELAACDFREISDGQRQRVMLARAICQEPEVLILDEPTSYLDIKYKLDFLSVLQEMRKKKKVTVIMSLHELELAEKVSDKILCVNGKYVEKYGTPQEVFCADYIKELFHIQMGSYDELNGNIELQAPDGKPEVFVIAGSGTGRSVYRKLQRQGMPFATGVIYNNDLDYPVARALAAEVIEAEAFEPVAETVFMKAKRVLDNCDRVICCKKKFGTYDAANQELLRYARESGKQVEELWQK